MKNITCFSVVIIGLFLPRIATGQFVTHHNAIFQGEIAQPLPGVPFTDPNFQTPVVRLTDARARSINGLFPDYAKRQAWNSDESLMILRSAYSDAFLFNGKSYEFIKVLEGVAGDDVFWNPVKPDEIIYNQGDSILHRYNVTTDERTQIHSFAPFNFVNTLGEGNLSMDGKYYAAAERYYNFETGEVTFHDLIVYDLQEDRIVSTHLLPQGQLADFDWISISPLGNYVVVDYANWETGRYRGIEVYDRNFNFLWQKGLGPGHSDLGLDANGEEVLVMDIYSEADNQTHICKFALADGDSTHLLALSLLFDMHESCRALSRPGWVYVSTFDYFERLTDSQENWLPFEDEVFALKMDGSGTVERYAHHHSREYSTYTPDRDHGANYFAEPRATVSKDGTRILFASNWRIKMDEDFSIDAYLVDLRNMITGLPEAELSIKPRSFSVYPNPAGDHLYFQSDHPIPDYRIRLYDSIGRFLSEFIADQGSADLNVSTLPAGLIYYQINDKSGKLLGQGKIIKQ